MDSSSRWSETDSRGVSCLPQSRCMKWWAMVITGWRSEVLGFCLFQKRHYFTVIREEEGGLQSEELDLIPRYIYFLADEILCAFKNGLNEMNEINCEYWQAIQEKRQLHYVRSWLRGIKNMQRVTQVARNPIRGRQKQATNSPNPEMLLENASTKCKSPLAKMMTTR